MPGRTNRVKNRYRILARVVDRAEFIDLDRRTLLLQLEDVQERADGEFFLSDIFDGESTVDCLITIDADKWGELRGS